VGRKMIARPLRLPRMTAYEQQPGPKRVVQFFAFSGGHVNMQHGVSKLRCQEEHPRAPRYHTPPAHIRQGGDHTLAHCQDNHIATIAMAMAAIITNAIAVLTAVIYSMTPCAIGTAAVAALDKPTANDGE